MHLYRYSKFFASENLHHIFPSGAYRIKPKNLSTNPFNEYDNQPGVQCIVGEVEENDIN